MGHSDPKFPDIFSGYHNSSSDLPRDGTLSDTVSVCPALGLLTKADNIQLHINLDKLLDIYFPKSPELYRHRYQIAGLQKERNLLKSLILINPGRDLSY